MMNVTQQDFQKIYNALADDTSRAIYKHRLLYSLLGDKSEIAQMVDRYVTNASVLHESKICLYGAGEGGEEFLNFNNFDIPFFIDKYKTGAINNIPIISLDEFLSRPDYKEYTIVVTVANCNYQQEIKKELEQHQLNYFFERLSDDQYFDLVRIAPEYFSKEEFFVDAGVFDGDTSKKFFQHFPEGHSYMFEPVLSQHEMIKQNLQAYKNQALYPYGLYNINTSLRFDESGSKGCAQISEDGESTIEVRKLDDILQDKPVTFIKMDIEGSELAALQGAEKILRTQKPKLAISVYHKPEDMWEIPKLILEYCPEYKLYLRHYSMKHAETVLYAIV